MVAMTAGAGAVSSSIIVTSQSGLHGCSIVYPKVSSAISRGCSRVIFAETATERSPGMLGSLVWAYARAGRRSDALRLVEELKKRQHTGYVPADAFLNSYLGLGDKDEAFVWFERAIQKQSNVLKYVKVFPVFDEVRDDPRFKDLVRRVGLS